MLLEGAPLWVDVVVARWMESWMDGSSSSSSPQQVHNTWHALPLCSQTLLLVVSSVCCRCYCSTLTHHRWSAFSCSVRLQLPAQSTRTQYSTLLLSTSLHLPLLHTARPTQLSMLRIHHSSRQHRCACRFHCLFDSRASTRIPTATRSMSATSPSCGSDVHVSLRRAVCSDAAELHSFIRRLAEFDGMADQSTITVQQLQADGWPTEHKQHTASSSSPSASSPPSPRFHAWLAVVDSSASSGSGSGSVGGGGSERVIGCSLSFLTYRSWKGLTAYGEDVFVLDEWRRVRWAVLCSARWCSSQRTAAASD